MLLESVKNERKTRQQRGAMKKLTQTVKEHGDVKDADRTPSFLEIFLTFFLTIHLVVPKRQNKNSTMQ